MVGDNALSFHRNESAWLIAQQTAKATLTRAVAREQLRLTRTGTGIPYWAWALLLLPWILFWSVNPIGLSPDLPRPVSLQHQVHPPR